jgi:hypothetical protein
MVPPGVNFTNILCAAFGRADFKSAKNADNLTVFFALLGAISVKRWCNRPLDTNNNFLKKKMVTSNEITLKLVTSQWKDQQKKFSIQNST